MRVGADLEGREAGDLPDGVEEMVLGFREEGNRMEGSEKVAW